MLTHPAQAAGPSACLAAYETAATDYWRIVSDMVHFKTLFDNYDGLCQKYYPVEIEKLQPDADLLRAQVARDIRNVPPAMTKIFNDTLTAAVPPSCAKDTKSRDKIRRSFLTDMKKQLKTMEARMRKSAGTVRNPETSLKLCRDLRALAPVIKKELGPELSTPLLTMSEVNRQYMVKDSAKLKSAFATYKKTLAALPPESKKMKKK